jgi:hypothetical protein
MTAQSTRNKPRKILQRISSAIFQRKRKDRETRLAAIHSGYDPLATSPLRRQGTIPQPIFQIPSIQNDPGKRMGPIKRAFAYLAFAFSLSIICPSTIKTTMEPIEKFVNQSGNDKPDKTLQLRSKEKQRQMDKKLINAATSCDLRGVLEALGEGTSESARYSALAEVTQYEHDRSSDASMVATFLRHSLGIPQNTHSTEYLNL